VTFGIPFPRAPNRLRLHLRRRDADGGGRWPGDTRFRRETRCADAERYSRVRENTCGTRAYSSCAASVLARVAGGAGARIVAACRAAFAARQCGPDFLRVGREAFAACPADSIDYAVMEKLAVGDGVVIPFAAGWSDVGAWDRSWQIDGKDSDGNVLRGDVMG